ncbi:MAG: protocatechuate 3,4-dioxygenase subunit alpha, partial [Rhizobacter sp.]
MTTLLRETASQTAGPYVHIGLAPKAAGFDIFENDFGNVLVSPATKGERIRIEGIVYDGAGAPMRDVLVEIWQANAEGRYAHPGDRQKGKSDDPAFRGWGRAVSDFDTGLYTFETVKPGPVMGRNGRLMAPHIGFWIVARGINIGLNTRMYFGDEAKANAADPVLALVDNPARRQTLVAAREQRGAQTVY